MPASKEADQRSRKTLPVWPFVVPLPPLLLAGVWLSLWLPEFAERSAHAHLSKLPDLKIFRSSSPPALWPGIPVNRFTQWLHGLRPPHPPEFHLVIGAGFPRDEFRRIGSLRSISNFSATGSSITDADLERLGRGVLVGSVVLDDTAVTDAGLAHLQKQPLRRLSLRNTRVGDAGVQALAGVSLLERLDLSGTAVTGRGFSRGGFGRLTTLSLGRAPVDDGGVSGLTGCPSLRSIDLYFARVTDACMTTLGGMRNVVSLSLDRTAVGDAGLAAYDLACRGSRGPRVRLSLRYTRITGAGLASLVLDSRALYLTGTAVGDEVADWLAARRHLSELEMDGTGLTDAGLAKLEASPNLQRVSVKGCPVTEAGAIRFLVSGIPVPGRSGGFRSGRWGGAKTHIPGLGAVDALGRVEATLPYPPEIVEALWRFRGIGKLER
jgi:hypothetical protein